MRMNIKCGRRVMAAVLAVLALVFVCAPTSVFASSERNGSAWIDSGEAGAVVSGASYRPQDDYAAAVNGEWALTALADDASPDSLQNAISAKVEEQKKSILKDSSLTSHEAKVTRKFYRMATSWELRNSEGVNPLIPYLKAILGIRTIAELNDFLTDRTMNFTMDTLCGLELAADPDDPARYAIRITPTPLLLGDAAEYTGEPDSEGQDDIAVYFAETEYLYERAGLTAEEADAVVNGALDFETLLAAYMDPEEEDESSAADGTAHTADTAGLAAAEGEYPLTAILAAYGCGENTGISYELAQPRWLQGLAGLYTEENLAGIKDYLIVRLIHSSITLLDRDSYDFASDLERELYGTEPENDESAIGYQYVETYLSGPLDAVWVQQYADKHTKKAVTELTDEILSAYREVLSGEDWLSEEARTAALEKLDSMTLRICYPDNACYYTTLDFSDAGRDATLMNAVHTIENYYADLSVWKMNRGVNLAEWNYSASDANCYYDPSDNSIYIPAGMADSGLYDPKASREENLAGIGFVIAHEISHAFENGTALEGADGMEDNSRTAADYASFTAKVSKLIEYYDHITPAGITGNYNGANVASEAIADMGGMKCILTIASKAPAFDYDAFFRAYAGLFRSVRSSAEEQELFCSDAHPLPYLRINVTLQQFDEFYRTYGITEGDGMYLAPEDRIAIW